MEDIYGSATAAVGGYLPTKITQEGHGPQISIPNEIDNEELKASKYLVGCLDALGFKALLKNKSLEEKEVLERARNSLRRTRSLKRLVEEGKSPWFEIWIPYPNGKLRKATKPEEIRRWAERELGNIDYANKIVKNSLHFSDTIIFFIEAEDVLQKEEENIEKLDTLCRIMNLFISKSILQTHRADVKPLAYRAAISYGLGIMDKEYLEYPVFIGEPIIEAYELMGAQEWMGGAICSSVPENWVKENIGYNKQLFKYKIPLKRKDMLLCFEQYWRYRSSIKYVLNWPQAHKDTQRYAKKEIPALMPTYKDLGGHIKQYWKKEKNQYWEKEKRKKKNTLKFVTTVCEDWKRHLL